MPSSRRTSALTLLAVLLLCPQAQAADPAAPPAQRLTLMQAWQAAAQHDRQLDMARAEQAAVASRRGQASALWKPSVFLNGSAGRGAGNTRMEGAQFSTPGIGTVNGVDFATSVNHGTATRWGVELRQPLFSPVRSAQRAQLDLAADMGDTAWQTARAGLMLQTAERYFALAVAEERSRVLALQSQSVARTTQEAHDRFTLGMTPVTDTHEADAESAGVQAQVAAALLDVQIKRQMLADSTAVPAPHALLPAAAVRLDDLTPGTLEAWLEKARASNLQLVQSRQALEMARHAVRQQAPLAGVSLDLVAQAGQNRLWGNGDFGAVSNRNSHRMVGVQLSIPLYSGGMSSARQQEARHQLEKAQAQLDAAEQQVQREVQAAWWGLQAGQAQVQALEQAQQAMRARLDATRMGRALGDRSTLDVLIAENAYAQSLLAVAEARSAQVVNRLRLAMLAHALDDALLQQISDRIKPPVSGAAAAATSASAAIAAAMPSQAQTVPKARARRHVAAR